jgi:CheY-like chemotaxis protein
MRIVQLVLVDQRVLPIAQVEDAPTAELVRQHLEEWVRRGVSLRVPGQGEPDVVTPARIARVAVVVDESVRLPKPSTPSTLGHLRVLLVDDEYNEIAGLRRALRFDTWQISHAFSGEEALKLLERDVFDVVISDITMRGMSGIELLEEVKREMPRLVRVLLSGVIESQTLIDAAKVADVHLCKPCTAEQIKARVSEAMAARLPRR